MKRKLHILTLGALAAVWLGAFSQYASAAGTSAPPSPSPDFSLVKAVDRESPELYIIFSLLTYAL
jgi:hypothetical protein